MSPYASPLESVKSIMRAPTHAKFSSSRLYRSSPCAATHSPTGRPSLNIFCSSHAIHRTMARPSRRYARRAPSISTLFFTPLVTSTGQGVTRSTVDCLQRCRFPEPVERTGSQAFANAQLHSFGANTLTAHFSPCARTLLTAS